MVKSQKGRVLLCAGGTGGHLFPAEAVAHVLIGRGYDVQLVSDERVSRFAENFPGSATHEVRSATLGGGVLDAVKALMKLFSGYRAARLLIRKTKPVAVVGFGGYPTLPPLFAAVHLKVPTLVHEANGVLGRANRLLSRKVDAVAFGHENPQDATGIQAIVTGNPVRPHVLEAAKVDYPERGLEDPFQLLVFGGSQGAAYFSEVLPAAIGLLSSDLKSRLRITQQARPEDEAALKAAYAQAQIKHAVSPFFSNMGDLLAASQLVISRAGASTVSELAVIGRPSVLVPYPHALDHDQAANAAAMAALGAAEVVSQDALTPEKLAQILKTAIEEPETLAKRAQNAKQTSRPDAADTLADHIEALIRL